MIVRNDFRQLTAPQKAQVILDQARSELSDRLWRSALGATDASAGPLDAPIASRGEQGMGLEALIGMLAEKAAGLSSAAAEPAPTGATDAPPEPVAAAASTGTIHGLGPNARHEAALTAAAARTGIPAPALAAIVNAEAAKAPDGSWKDYSRNPRSTAAGIGQFLSGTWQGMAEIKGTWLNQVAERNGWLGSNGRVLPSARTELLALRYDSTASINTVADYARHNLDGLKRRGVAIGDDPDAVARSAYISHHLGLGDATRFLTRGGLDPARARTVLAAQVGSSRAGEQIAAAGNATSAHRAWLLGYVDRNLRPERFA